MRKARLFARGGMLHAELLPVSGSEIRDLSKERLVHFLTAIVGDKESPHSGAAWHERLCGLGFMAEREDGAPEGECCNPTLMRVADAEPDALSTQRLRLRDQILLRPPQPVQRP